MWFDNWPDTVRVALIGPLAYASLVLFLRLSGKRTLAKLNAFDFVVTVALGSTLATVLLSSDVSFAEGALGLGMLVALQYVVASASRRLPAVRRLVKSEPQVVMRNGTLLHDVLRKERLNVDEVHQALRQSGIADMADVAAVVLETDGSFSILATAVPGASALADVRGWSSEAHTDDG
ncbi:MAG: DUF421 domain-containing protein [Actinomycetota bacterium]|nr:DUF421 domain-containing protein [Actinomycetota bacterium]MDP9019390.1 DUF421 domain-containing protein [Actinomycetota bacterium]